MEKLYPNQLNIAMGVTETAQVRRKAYSEQAQKEGITSLSAWAKKTLDKAAGFENA